MKLLAAHAGARCVAGGATLVAMMNAGLIEPTALISLERVKPLAGIEPGEDGSLRIGAMTRHAETARSTLFRDGQQVLPQAARCIANVAVRNMGTLGGSIAFADPAADYLPALAVLDASIETRSPCGTRLLSIAEFITDWYTTALSADEIIVAVRLAAVPPNSIGLYEKLERVAGDFAIASVALLMGFSGEICVSARIAVGGCAASPVRRREAEQVLEGSWLDAASIAKAGGILAEASDPVDDVRASAEYRRLVIPRLLDKVVTRARAGMAT